MVAQYSTAIPLLFHLPSCKFPFTGQPVWKTRSHETVHLKVVGIFPVAAYNGGSRNVAKHYRVLIRMKVKLDELNRPGVQLAGASVTCPCIVSFRQGCVNSCIPDG